MKKFINKVIEWVRQDGLLHIGCSFLITFIMSVMSTWWIGVIFALICGIGKEVIDKCTGGDFEWHDIICDLIGIVLGCLLWVIYASIVLW